MCFLNENPSRIYVRKKLLEGVWEKMKIGHKTSWTVEEDSLVMNAIHDYNRISPIPFPEHPFQPLPISSLTFFFTQPLDKENKQIRQRWICHLCQKIRSVSILQEDQPLVIRLCRENPGRWRDISFKVFEIFNEQQYYSDNAIKNFWIRFEKQNFELKKPNTAVKRPLKDKVPRQLENSVEIQEVDIFQSEFDEQPWKKYKWNEESERQVQLSSDYVPLGCSVDCQELLLSSSLNCTEYLKESTCGVSEVPIENSEIDLLDILCSKELLEIFY